MIKIDQTIALVDCKIAKIKELKVKRTEFVESGVFIGTDDAWPQYNTFYAGIEACTTVQEVRAYNIDFT